MYSAKIIFSYPNDYQCQSEIPAGMIFFDEKFHLYYNFKKRKTEIQKT